MCAAFCRTTVPTTISSGSSLAWWKSGGTRGIYLTQQGSQSSGNWALPDVTRVSRKRSPRSLESYIFLCNRKPRRNGQLYPGLRIGWSVNLYLLFWSKFQDQHRVRAVTRKKFIKGQWSWTQFYVSVKLVSVGWKPVRQTLKILSNVECKVILLT